MLRTERIRRAIRRPCAQPALTRLTRPDVVAAEVEGNPPEPRAELTRLAVPRQGMPGSHEGFLADVFGISRGSKAMTAETLQGRAMTFHQSAEGLAVASGRRRRMHGIPAGIFGETRRRKARKNLRELAEGCHGSTAGGARAAQVPIAAPS